MTVIDLAEWRKVAAARDDATEDEWHCAYDDAADDGRDACRDYAEILGATLAGQQVAIGAMRLAFDMDGAEGLKRLMDELVSAAAEWVK